MNEPKWKPGDRVIAELNLVDGYKPAIIEHVEAEYTYRLRFDNGQRWNQVENKVKPPVPSPEEAWEKATITIGTRLRDRQEYCCLNADEIEDWNRETRHQVYQILGAAGIKITGAVKADVRRLIAVADKM